MQKPLPYAMGLLALLTACTDQTRTPDNTVLLSRRYPLPAAWAAKFRNAPVKSFQQTVAFADPAATARIECTAAVLDTQNSVLISTKITLLHGAPGCTYSATADSIQINQATKEAPNTYGLATVKWARQQLTVAEEQTKTYTILSQGMIAEL
jgi:hypothetical protein